MSYNILKFKFIVKIIRCNLSGKKFSHPHSKTGTIFKLEIKFVSTLRRSQQYFFFTFVSYEILNLCLIFSNSSPLCIFSFLFVSLCLCILTHLYNIHLYNILFKEFARACTRVNDCKIDRFIIIVIFMLWLIEKNCSFFYYY